MCPAELAGSLDSKVRRWIHNPVKILMPYLAEGMTALDVGCGPGYFTIDMANLVGDSGHVFAADLQNKMLQIVKQKIAGTSFEKRITLHKCESDKIGLNGSVDFVLLFYMVHEVPDPSAFFKEIYSLVNPNGQVLMVEPPVHVSKSAFNDSIILAQNAGFKIMAKPKMFPDKAVVLLKN